MTQQTVIGSPCKRGHDGFRFALTRNCVHCTKQFSAERARNQRLRDPQKFRDRATKFQASEKGKAALAKYKNSEARKKVLKKYNESDKGAIAKAKYAGSEKQRAAARRAAAKPKSVLARALRNRVRKIIKRGKSVRAGSAVRDVGCSLYELKAYIAAKFLDGMDWDNYGEWELDHIKPLAAFDLSVRAQFLEAVHYENLQPLWSTDNRRKAAKLPPHAGA